jgi:hypothetical protein
VKGKPWTVDEEKQLRVLLAENKSVRAIAKVLGKTRDCVRIKIARLGLEVVVQTEKSQRTTTTSASWVLPCELPSIEEELKVLAAALKSLETPNLDKTEVLRLRGIIQGVKVYQELLADYLDYRGLDSELLEWREKYADLAKKASDVASKSAS